MRMLINAGVLIPAAAGSTGRWLNTLPVLMKAVSSRQKAPAPKSKAEGLEAKQTPFRRLNSAV